MASNSSSHVFVFIVQYNWLDVVLVDPLAGKCAGIVVTYYASPVCLFLLLNKPPYDGNAFAFNGFALFDKLLRQT